VFSQQRIYSAVVALLPVEGGQIVVYLDGVVVKSDAENRAVWKAQLPSRINAADLNSIGGKLALGGMDGAVSLLDVADAHLLWRTPIDGSPVTTITAGGDGAIWVGTYQGSLGKVAPTGEVERTLSLQQPVVEVAYSATRNTVFLAEHNGAVRAYQANTLAPLWSNPDLPGYVFRVDPRDGELVLSPQSDAHRLYWLSAQSGELQRELQLAAAPYAFEFASGGERVAVHHHDIDSYSVYDTASGTVLAEWTIPATAAEMRANLPGTRPPVKRFHFDGDRLGSGTSAGTLYAVEFNPTRVQSFTHEVLTADLDRLVGRQAFDAEFAWCSDALAGSAYALYDLSEDGEMDLVRVDDRMDGSLDAEYALAAGLARRNSITAQQSLYLADSRVPANWSPLYSLFRGERP
jgi:outer membrane protein assembly factor BamB